MCLFGVTELKFNIKPLFIPQKRQNDDITVDIMKLAVTPLAGPLSL